MSKTFVLAIDLGTTTAAVKYGIPSQREHGVSSIFQDDWPHGRNYEGTKYVPTDLVYDVKERKLVHWGFAAKDFSKNPTMRPLIEEPLTIRHIKLLLAESEGYTDASPSSQKYQDIRNDIWTKLGKTPDEVFGDFLDAILGYAMRSTFKKWKKTLQRNDYRVELVLAFPSGWPERLHAKVAELGFRAIQKTLAEDGRENLKFDMQDVYTVSETLCGAKQWLKEVFFDDSSDSVSQLQVGDLFLPIDIGGGTGCMTVLQLASKDPLGVNQIEPTISLEVSGAAVELAFKEWITSYIKQDDYARDLQTLIRRVCDEFRNDKKLCGQELDTWTMQNVSGLRENPKKGFIGESLRINMDFIKACFDGPIDLLEEELKRTLRNHPTIKMVVFLGQFGARSAYLEQRMENSDIDSHYKDNFHFGGVVGKDGVVNGAYLERENPEQNFVRSFKTTRNYGTLVAIPYYEPEYSSLFPNAKEDGIGIFEEDEKGTWLRVIEWNIWKGTDVINGSYIGSGDPGEYRRHRTWLASDKIKEKGDHEGLNFDEEIVISDEPVSKDTRYTLWTEERKNGIVIVDGIQYRSRYKKFSCDLSTIHKSDSTGQILEETYQKSDLALEFFPLKKKKGTRRKLYRKLDFILHFNITETQLKCFMELEIGEKPYQKVLATEELLGDTDKKQRESRSLALEHDIKLTYTNRESAGLRHSDSSDSEISRKKRKRVSNPISRHATEAPQPTTTSQDRAPSEDTIQADSESEQDLITFSPPRTETMSEAMADNCRRNSPMQLDDQITPSSKERHEKKPPHDIWDLPSSPEPEPDFQPPSKMTKRSTWNPRSLESSTGSTFFNMVARPLNHFKGSSTNIVHRRKEDEDAEQQSVKPASISSNTYKGVEPQSSDAPSQFVEESSGTGRQNLSAPSRGRKARRGGSFRPGRVGERVSEHHHRRLS